MFSPVRLLIQKLYLASEIRMKLSKKLHAVSWSLSSESFADSSRTGTVERHVRVVYITMKLAESAHSAAPSGSCRLQSSINFGSIN